MATNVAIDDVLDGVLGQIATLAPATGEPVTTLKPFRSVSRYAGEEFTTEEGFKRGIAGRCPAARVRFAGTKVLKSSISRRATRVESSVSVVVCTDSQRGKDDRKSLHELSESVRNVIGGRAFGLPLSAMRYEGTSVLRDDDQLLAFALTFSTRHRVDFTIDAGDDLIETASGEIRSDAEDDDRLLGEVDVALGDA